MAGVVAALMEFVVLVHPVSFPVLHLEALGQEVGLKSQVQEELGMVGRDFVKNLLLRLFVERGAGVVPGTLLAWASHIKADKVPILVHLGQKGNFLVVEAGEELLCIGGERQKGDYGCVQSSFCHFVLSESNCLKFFLFLRVGQGQISRWTSRI